MDITREIEARCDCKAQLSNLKQAPLPPISPLFLKIKLLWNCNLSCKFCLLPSNVPPMAFEKVKTIIDQAVHHQVKKIHFSGGEVFLHPRIMDILSYGVSKNLQINLTTNGTLLDKQIIKELRKIKLHSITLSLDGPAPSIHDRLHGGKGSFKKVYKALELLCHDMKKKPKVRVNTVVSPENVFFLDDIHTMLAHIHPAISWKIIPVDTEQKKYYLTEEMTAYLAEHLPDWHLLDDLSFYKSLMKESLIQKITEKYGKGQYSLGYYKNHICYMPWLHLFITPDGFAFPCCMSRGKIAALGNVFKQTIEQIINSSPMENIRLNMASGNCLDVCRYCDDFIIENKNIDELIEQ